MIYEESDVSRQHSLLGKGGQDKLAGSSVLVVGLDYVTVEAMKNLALVGLGTFYIVENGRVEANELHSHFLCTQETLGMDRFMAFKPGLQQLNPFVSYNQLDSLPTVQDIVAKGINMAIFSNQLSVQEDVVVLDKELLMAGVKVIISECFGLNGFVFTDFGPEYTYMEGGVTNYEMVWISHISVDDKSINVKLHDHLFEGAGIHENVVVEFLCASPQFEGHYFLVNAIITAEKETVEGPISETTVVLVRYDGEQMDNINIDIENPENVYFRRVTDISKTMKMPSFGEYWNQSFIETGDSYWNAWVQFLRVLPRYREKTGRLPRLRNKEDAQALAQLCEGTTEEEILDLIVRCALTSDAYIAPMGSLLGGVVSQIALQGCIERFRPNVEPFLFTVLDWLPNWDEEDSYAASPEMVKYTSQIGIFGSKIQSLLSKLKIIQLGAGATGSEILKNMMLMGVSTLLPGEESDAQTGQILLIEPDTVAPSNRTRQLYYRLEDTNEYKAEVVTKKLKLQSKDMCISISPQFFTPQTMFKTFTHKFLNENNFLDSEAIIITAVDNRDARTLGDTFVQLYPNFCLLDLGVGGFNVSSQVVIPDVLAPYRLPREHALTVHKKCYTPGLPYLPDHCIDTARSIFTDLFQEMIHIFLLQQENVSIYEPVNQNSCMQVAGRLSHFGNVVKVQNIESRKMMLKWFIYQYFLELSTFLPKSAGVTLCKNLSPVTVTEDDKYISLAVELFEENWLKPLSFDKDEPKQVNFVRECAIFIANKFAIPTDSLTLDRVRVIAGEMDPSIIMPATLGAAITSMNLYMLASKPRDEIKLQELSHTMPDLWVNLGSPRTLSEHISLLEMGGKEFYLPMITIKNLHKNITIAEFCEKVVEICKRVRANWIGVIQQVLWLGVVVVRDARNLSNEKLFSFLEEHWNSNLTTEELDYFLSKNTFLHFTVRTALKPGGVRSLTVKAEL